MEHVNFTFKEICEKTGYASSAIRYYEKEFDLNIPRDGNGRRVFTKIEFDKLLFIKELQSKHYTNAQIKKLFMENHGMAAETDELAATDARNMMDTSMPTVVPSGSSGAGEKVIRFIDEKFNMLNTSIEQLNENINSKERDVLITENAKLKMEIKRKTYELIELKENLRYEKGKKKGFFKKLFS